MIAEEWEGDVRVLRRKKRKELVEGTLIVIFGFIIGVFLWTSLKLIELAGLVLGELDRIRHKRLKPGGPGYSPAVLSEEYEYPTCEEEYVFRGKSLRCYRVKGHDGDHIFHDWLR